MLPLRPGLPARQTTTTKRNGTTTLFAALEVATGKIIADGLLSPAPAPAAHPAVELHIVADNYATHKHPEVRTRCQPFAWTKTSEDILTRAGRQRRQPT